MDSVRWPTAVELEEDAARIRAWIEISATRARRDPDFAREQGIVPQQGMSLFASIGGIGPIQRVDWLSGAVTL